MLEHVSMEMYLVCAILTNARTCLYGNMTSDNFGCEPPVFDCFDCFANFYFSVTVFGNFSLLLWEYMDELE